jgi:hypothetical protein
MSNLFDLHSRKSSLHEPRGFTSQKSGLSQKSNNRDSSYESKSNKSIKKRNLRVSQPSHHYAELLNTQLNYKVNVGKIGRNKGNLSRRSVRVQQKSSTVDVVFKN